MADNAKQEERLVFVEKAAGHRALSEARKEQPGHFSANSKPLTEARQHALAGFESIRESASPRSLSQARGAKAAATASTDNREGSSSSGVSPAGRAEGSPATTPPARQSK